VFDACVAESEEGSVSLSSLGSPELLAKNVDRTFSVLSGWELFRSDRRVLEIGCGIGVFQERMAPLVREAHGIDVSAGMVEAARRRCAHLPNVSFQRTNGTDLSIFGDGSMDVVLALDSFPYLHFEGDIIIDGVTLAERHFAEVKRVLSPGGHFAIVTYSYRQTPSGELDVAADAADIRRLASRHGFVVVVEGQPRARDVPLAGAFLLRASLGWRAGERRP
jgi:SAM-dependent methyltransferase